MDSTALDQFGSLGFPLWVRLTHWSAAGRCGPATVGDAHPTVS
ncbi:MAG: hypothetical protein ACP5XB_13015 [Isosphaeraceae bacterium]